jgi:hypothetical protein
MKVSHPVLHRSPRCRRAARLSAVMVTLVTVACGGHAARAEGSGAPSTPTLKPKPTSKAWYVADSCTWTPEDRRNCRTVLRFLAAFDLGQTEVACRQLSGRFLAQRNIGGLKGCAAYLHRHGANRRIEYSIAFSRLRPDGGEVVYTINPPSRRNVERRYVAVTILERGVSKIDALTAVDN